jgi:hypothetical protein
MAPLTPGKTFVFGGLVNMYWALLGTKLPGFDIPFGGAMPTGWNQIYDLTGPLAVRPRNPRDEIQGEFHSRLGSIRGGGGGGGRGGGGGGGGGGRGGAGGGGGGPGVSIAFEVRTPEYELWRKGNSFGKTIVGSQTAKRELKVTAGATTGGNLLVTPPGGPAVSIAVLGTDATAPAIATKIAAGTFTGWTVAVKAGATDTVVFTAAAPGLKNGIPAFAPAGTGVAATWSTVDPGHWGITTSYVEPEGQHHVMFCAEFIPQSGSQSSGFFPQQSLVRFFGMECENVGQPEDIWGRSGAASTLTPNIQLECIPTVPLAVTDPQIAGTGMENAQDPEGLFWYAHTPLSDPAV